MVAGLRFWGAAVLAGIPCVEAHGTGYEILGSRRITVRASFDTGAPMSMADVLVFPPGETQVLEKLKTDSGGVFSFVPDRPGTWVLQVRDRSGHGMRINLDIDENLRICGRTPSEQPGGMRKIVAALCVVWGFIGTALFFRGRKR